MINLAEHGIGLGQDDTPLLRQLIENATESGTRSASFFVPPDCTVLLASGETYQIPMPSNAVSNPQITVTFKGEARPPFQFHPTYDCPPPQNGYAIFKSTLNDNGNAVFGTTVGQTNVNLCFENIIFEMPPNPTRSCLNFQNLQANEIRNCLIHCGSVDLSNIDQPTHANTYGVIMPPESHSPYAKIDGLTVFGYYNGIKLGELTEANGLRLWGCRVGVVTPFAHHPSLLHSLGTYWCGYGLRAEGEHPIRIGMWDIEHANGRGAAWQNNVADVDDLNNVIFGDAHWLAVSSGVGNDHTLVKHGGTRLLTYEIGGELVAPPPPPPPPPPPTDPNWTVYSGAFRLLNDKHNPYAGTLNVQAKEWGLADGAVSAVVNRGQQMADLALLLRYAGDEYLIFDLRASDDTVQFVARQGGQWVYLASAPMFFDVNTAYTLRVEMDGNTLTGYVNDVQVLQVQSSLNASSTEHGMWASLGGGANECSFADFSVE